MSDFLCKGFILSLEYLNSNMDSYSLTKFIHSLDFSTEKIVALKIDSYDLLLNLNYSFIPDILVIGYGGRMYPKSSVSVTSTLNEINELVKVGVSVIYIDASTRIRPNNQIIHEFYYNIKYNFPEIRIIGEVSTDEDIKNISSLKFDAISLNGNYNLIDSLDSDCFNVPVIFSYSYKRILNCNHIFSRGFNNIIVSSKFFTPQYKVSEFIENIF